MKKQVASVFQRQYLPLLIALAVTAALAGRVKAGIGVDAANSAGMDAASAGLMGGGLPAWNIPFAPASQDFTQGLGDFLFNHGEAVYKQAPELRLINDERLTPESRRRIAGALGISDGASKSLLNAIKNHHLDRATLNAIGTAILNAYSRNEFKGKITKAINARVGEVRKIAKTLSPCELSFAAAELEPFATISEKADTTASAFVLAARAKTKEDSQKILAEFMGSKVGDDIEFTYPSIAYGDHIIPRRDSQEHRNSGLKEASADKDAPADAALVPMPKNGIDDPRGTMDPYTMARLARGYDVLKYSAFPRLSEAHVEANSDAALLRDLVGKKFQVAGIMQTAGYDRIGVNVYSKSADRWIYLAVLTGRAARKRLKSLPARGAKVTVDFTVAAPDGKNSGPFQVESIRPTDGTALPTESKNSSQKPFHWRDLRGVLSGVLLFLVITGGATLVWKGFVGTGVLLILAYFGYLLVSAGGPAESDYPPYTKP